MSALRRELSARLNWFLLFTLIMAVVAAWPLLSEPGLLNTRGGGDSPFLLQRLHQLETAVRDGHFPVRWMPDANYGYGYPFFNFYAPLSIYIAAIFRFIGFSYVRSLQLAQLAGFLTAAIGMFYLARRWFQSEWAGLLTAVAYTLAPFHMVNIYVRGDSLAEFWAMAFYPLILLAVDWIFNGHERRRAVALFAFFYAALILSHNISALIFSPFLLLYLLFRWAAAPTNNSNTHFKTILPILGGLCLALGLAAWFFLPALAEKSLAQLGPVTEGYFHFSNHFLGTAERPLSQTTLFFDYTVDGLTAFRMGGLQAALLLVSLILLLITWRRPHSLSSDRRFFLLAMLLISTLMLLPLSRLLWQVVPLLSFTQFPWRFLSVQAFAGALAAGVLTYLPGRRYLIPGLVILLVAGSLARLQTDHLLLTDADVNAAKLAEYEWFTGNIGTTVSAEYLPLSVQPRPVTSAWLHSGRRHPVNTLDGELLTAVNHQATTTTQIWQVETTGPSTLSFPTLYWPGWEASLDGQITTVRPAPGSGLLTVEVPAGRHEVSLQLKRTPVRLAAELLSLTAVLCLLWLLKPKKWSRPRKSWAVIGAGALALLLLVRLWPQPSLAAHNLTWDFAQMAYLHHDVNGVPYSNGLTFLRYAYSQEHLSPPETITITTEWASAAADSSVTLQLVTPAVHRYQNPPPVLVSQEQALTSDSLTFTLTIPADAPSGLYVPQLLVANGHPLLPSGGVRGSLFLRPLRIQNAPPPPPTAAALDVRALDVQPRPDGSLALHLAWFTDRPLSANYNVALRLTDAQGQFLQLADSQPGYGFQPSSLWPPAEWTNDRLALSLPETEHEYPYRLVAQLYDVSAPNTAVLTRLLGKLSPQNGELVFAPQAPLFELPADYTTATAVFGEQIELRGYDLTSTAADLTVTFYWEALAPIERDFTRFVHLVPLTDQQPVAQIDGLPQANSYPTSQWVTAEIVSDTIRIPLLDVPDGAYQLLVGFYEQQPDGSFPRLTAVDENGAALPANTFLLPEQIKRP